MHLALEDNRRCPGHPAARVADPQRMWAAQISTAPARCRACIPVAVAARPRTERNPQRKSALKVLQSRVTDVLRSGQGLPKAVAGGTYTDTGPVGGDFLATHYCITPHEYPRA